MVAAAALPARRLRRLSDSCVQHFYILLTVHPNIMRVFFFYQLDVQILYFNTFIIFLCMFRALIMLVFRRTIVLVQYLVTSLSFGDCSD